jgi:hypothetical protein
VSESEFVVPGADARLTFDRPEAGRCPRVVVRYSGLDLSAKRAERPALAAAKAAEYAGDYYSRELGVVYEVSAHGAEVRLRHPRGLEVLLPTADDAFEAPYPFGQLTFARGPDGRVRSLAVNAGPVRNLRFEKAEIKPAGR